MTVAALFVETNGVYYGLDDVDPWDEERDARLYAGPWPVVAHPPCNRWCKPLAFVNQTRYGYKVGNDGGCFKAALHAVRTYGGVLEHPAHSAAWDVFDLPKPGREGWTASLDDELGLTTEVEQHFYGHSCEKKTWLYYVGSQPPELIWRRSPQGTLPPISFLGNAWRGRRPKRDQAASATPPLFRDALLAMARSASPVPLANAQRSLPESASETRRVGGLHG